MGTTRGRVSKWFAMLGICIGSWAAVGTALAAPPRSAPATKPVKDVASARPALPTRGIQKVGPGEYHCFFLVNGRLLVIGGNRAGQMGIGNTGAAGKSIPVPVVLPDRVRIVDVAAGGYHSLAADTDGRVWTWGSNYYGQRGDGTPVGEPGTSEPRDTGTPVMIPTDADGKPFDKVVAVCSTLWFNTAIKRDGSLYVWGQNGELGVLGTGDTTSVMATRPTRVTFPEPGVQIIDVSLSRTSVLALDAKGGVWAWGGGPKSNIPRGVTSDDYGRPQRLANIPPMRAITNTASFNLALDAKGELWGWGRASAILGLPLKNGGSYIVPLPVKLSFPEFGRRKVTSVVASGVTVHVLLDDGTLWGWGDSAMGGVGNGQILDFSQHDYAWNYKPNQLLVSRPVQIAPKVKNFKAIYSNSLCFYTYAMTADGRTFSWGRNKTGIIGNGIKPTGQVAERPDSWNVPIATEVRPLSLTTEIRTPSK